MGFSDCISVSILPCGSLAFSSSVSSSFTAQKDKEQVFKNINIPIVIARSAAERSDEAISVEDCFAPSGLAMTSRVSDLVFSIISFLVHQERRPQHPGVIA